MPLFSERMDPAILHILGLVGLFVQAFCAWIFVAVLAALREPQRGRGEARSGAYGSFQQAFLALALALSVMSFRFWPGRGLSDQNPYWQQGQLAPTACYVLYMALKGWFGLCLVRGSYELRGGGSPAWLRTWHWPVIALMAATPLAVPYIDPLLIIQAPVMVACALLALRGHWPLRSRDSGARIVAAGLASLALIWTFHAGVELSSQAWPLRKPLISLNSFIDLGVQLALGIGLVVSLLQQAHRRALEAEQEEARLRRELEKDDKLRALGTVVSGVAHELNNPLTVILGYAELLQESCVDGTAAILTEQAERCRGIVRNLSALAGQSVHPLEEIDLEQLARRVVRGLSPELTSEGRGVWVDDMHGLHLYADRIGVEQVLANLLSNALDASPKGGVVTVRARAVDDGVELVVLDEGPGVPAGDRGRLFEPFFTTKAPGKGTGLGLSIAHAIVRAHGGSMRVEGGPAGRGSAFVTRLPLHGSQDPSGRPPAAPLPAAATQDGLVLVVDDDPAVRAILLAQAKLRGWRAIEASRAEEALAAPLAEIDAVLCDVRMPGIGGAGFYDRLVADSPQIAARVLFMTGDLASPQALAFAERCPRPLLQKPFDFDNVFERLAQIAAVQAR